MLRQNTVEEHKQRCHCHFFAEFPPNHKHTAYITCACRSSNRKTTQNQTKNLPNRPIVPRVPPVSIFLPKCGR